MGLILGFFGYMNLDFFAGQDFKTLGRVIIGIRFLKCERCFSMSDKPFSISAFTFFPGHVNRDFKTLEKIKLN